MTTPTARWALYFAPAPDSVWWSAGSAWLGHCADTGENKRQPAIPGVSSEAQAQLTATPARYGWHATLKAPFELAIGVSETQLAHRLSGFAASQRAFTLPRLRVQRMGDVLALMPESADPRLQALADACVTQMHDLAAPLSVSELARRRASGLSARQEDLLQAWGYPHVLEQFQFHFSLTGSLWGQPEATCRAMEQAARDWFYPLPPCRFDAVSLFVEPARHQPMRRVGRWALPTDQDT